MLVQSEVPSKSKGKKVEKPNLFRKKSPAHTQNQARNRNPQKRRKRGIDGSVCDTMVAQLHSTAYQRAKEVQANLSPHLPTFLKSMLPSHVTRGFWLGLPIKFCHLHLPKFDTMITLEDEDGELYQTKYLAQKLGLSAGWRRFAIAHNLLKMDVLIFHLVLPYKFKVYIIRSQGLDEVDGALGLLKLDDCNKQKGEVDSSFDAIEGNGPENFGAKGSQSDQLESTSEEFCGGIRFAESVMSFTQVTGMGNFSIVVNGLVIDAELSKYLKAKYYELCCSQRSFLHDHLLGGLNSKLVAGMISETINIADAIKGSKVTISPESLETWDKTLNAFESMGMNVSFLRIRLDQLMQLASRFKRYKEARLERDCAEEELKALEPKLMELKQTINRLDQEIDMNPDPQTLETQFQELANAPWS